MLNDPAAARDELLVARRLREEAGTRWNRAIRAGLRAGLSAVEVARLAGCSRQWVHKVKARGDRDVNWLDGPPRGSIG